MKKTLHWLPACAYMALIWVLSSMTLSIDASTGVPHTDKIVHFIEYAGLGLLVAHAVLRTWPEQPTARTWIIAVVITFAWGLLDELHQVSVPGRDADVFDLVADALGALAGSAIRAGVRSTAAAPSDEEAPT